MLEFTQLADRPGIEVIDRLEQHRYSLHTPEPVEPTPTETESFTYPVDEAARIETERIELPIVVGVYVRDATGTMVSEVEHLESVSLPAGRYVIELSTQLKTYIEVDAAVNIEADLTRTVLSFDDVSAVDIGVRSRHERPAVTVTTTDSPVDLMSAIETFGSALKTMDPERSYPTLRGHPPAVELGDSLEIPEGLSSPENGVTIELPTSYDVILAAAPLAYYLGASVEPGPAPRIKTESGFEYSLSSPRGVETEIAETLQQLFFLDCVTRTEGYYEIDLHERNEIEPLVDLDFAELYEMSLQEQLESYLEIPFSVIKDQIPEWRLTTHVDPAPKTIEQLPFVVDDLAIVKTIDNSPTVSNHSTAAAAGELARDDTFTRSAGATESGSDVGYVQPESQGTLEQAWIGDEIPIGASKLTEEAFRNRLERSTSDGGIEITIVVNDSRMEEEHDLVDRAYGDREELPFDVTVHRETTVSELRRTLTEKRGYLHYIGHTEQDGFECSDGKLDAAEIPETNLSAFLLNACNSYHQGLNLIEAGAIGGIVTLNDILNDGAVKIGESVARLLNAGFPLRASLTIARDESIQGGQYIVVGDGGMTVTQPASRTPNLLEISKKSSCYELEMTTYTTDDAGLGSVIMPCVQNNDEYFLTSGKLDPFELSDDQLTEFLNLEEVPVIVDGDLYWSTDIGVADI